MLNTDFELFYDLTLNTNAKTTCVLDHLCGLSTPDTCSGKCAVASTFNQAEAYSKVSLFFYLPLSLRDLHYPQFRTYGCILIED